MQSNKTLLYHIHRNNNLDNLWDIGREILMDNNKQSILAKQILAAEKALILRYENYDIDFIIASMEEMLVREKVEENLRDEFLKLLNLYYALRREQALEEGRKLFAPNAPSRFNALFFTDESNIAYWKKIVGDDSYNVYMVELCGNIFASADDFFPDSHLMLDLQIEKSKSYWQPDMKKYALNKEYLFQGRCQVVQKLS